MAAEAMKVTDPDAYTIDFGGINLNQGVADGEFFTAEPAAEQTTIKVGADGSIVRGKTRNRLWNMTIRLLETSLVNDALSAVATLDALTEGGAGVLPLLVRDRQGTTTLAAEKAWISKLPSITVSSEPGVREWTLQAEIVSPFIGGHI